MNKIDLYPAQRKTCRALATISKGNGKVRINNVPAEILEPKIAKEMVLTPQRSSLDQVIKGRGQEEDYGI
jgi:small subunit ribosomal protein S9